MHALRSDLALGAVAGALVLADIALVEQPSDGRTVTAVAALLLTGAVALRRRAPLLAAALLSAVLLGQSALGGQLTHMLSTGLVAAGLVFSTALHLPRSRAALGAGGVLAASWLELLLTPSDEYALVSDLVFTGVVVVGGPFLAGRALAERRATADRLQALTVQLAHEREQLAELAVMEERTRIAREMHDVVAHSVSLMVVQAGAARRMLDSRPERSRDAMLAVEDVGRQALAELRRILGVLRGVDVDPLAPMPGLAQLPQLVEQAQTAGLAVTVSVTGAPSELAPGVDLALYRLVQESLTNARKHSGASRAQVALAWTGDSLRLEVADPGCGRRTTTRGAGHGIVGMRERITACGGTFEAGPDGDGFAVRAVLPLEPTSAPA